MKTPKNIVTIALWVIAISSCNGGAPLPHESISEHAKENRCEPYIRLKAHCNIPMVALLSTPERYTGIEVATIGYLAGDPIPSNLFLSKDSWKAGDLASTIKLAPDPNGLGQIEKDIARFNSNYVQISGVVLPLNTSRSRNVTIKPNRITLVLKDNAYLEP
jgi:hypothetical protein